VNRERRRGIQWGLVNTLEDLDFADDLCLLSESYGNMQTKLEDLTNKAEKQESELTFWRWNYFFLILAQPVYKM